MKKRQLGSRIEERGASFSRCNAHFPRTSHLTPRTFPRRGILLLVVLSMLTLFLLIGTAFIVSANHYRKTLKTFAKATEASNSTIDQGNLLDEVINQIVRDTNNQNSTLRFHSLLRDMYGNDGLMAEINGSTWAGGLSNPTGGQMIQLTLNAFTDQFGIPKQLADLSQINNAYNGLVLTFLDGPLRGQSTRIVGYLPITPPSAPIPITEPIFRMMSPRKADGSNIVAADFPDLNASRILINGRPFNGTGVGYRRTATTGDPRLDAKETVPDGAGGTRQVEVALLPNSTSLHGFSNYANNFYMTDQEINYLSTNPDGLLPEELLELQTKWFTLRGPTGLGGSDESYDVADFQNMMLAQLPVNPVESVAYGSVSLGNMILPSLHRPALINYWRNAVWNSATPEFEPNMLRKVLLRPSWMDHPNFTGSNPEFANLLSNYQSTSPQPDAITAQRELLNSMIYGPWDVDNDNDGFRDSVWVDVGLPVMENADGRLVKPLAAIMVLDMDGRLNLNAHGSEDIANPANFDLDLTTDPSSPNPPPNNKFSSNILPHGQGYGPAEISLEPLMGGTTPADRRAWYMRFFEGAEADTWLKATDFSTPVATDRWKFHRRTAGKFGQRPIPGDITSKPLPGIDDPSVFDISAQLKMQGVPRWADGNILNTSSTANPILGGYASPPDYRGRYALGLNDLGQPVYESIIDIGFAGTEFDSNTPYELDLSLGAARGDSQTAPDGPYTMAELERILRSYDPDAGSLSSRIWKLAAEFKPTATATTPNLDALNLWRTTLTTDSYDLPVPSVVVPGWMVLGKDKMANTKDDYVRRMGKPAVGATFADLIEYRLRDDDDLDIDTNVAAPTTAQLNTIRQRMAKLLPPDLADGLRLDINRPLGNGRDDDNMGDPGYGVVDEPGEDEGAFWASSATQLDAFTGPRGDFRDERILLEDRNNDGLADAADRKLIEITGPVTTYKERVIVHNLRRQTLARDLYVMALTLVDPYDLTTDAGKLKTRQLAQWAINVVDYRDPDNIMTAFEYDENPFDGWEVDGNLDSTSTDNSDPDREVVWGMERPELVMTESLAWHDRRTSDETLELPNTGQRAGSLNASQDPDSDYDQLFRPQGAFFLELYNPWPANPASNQDTHLVTNQGDQGVNLGAVAIDPIGTSPSSPVWRLSIHKSTAATIGANTVLWDPDDPEPSMRPNNNASADRTVYFTNSTQVSNTDLQMMDLKDGSEFFTSLNMPTVRPGRYCVVGSGTPAAKLQGETQGFVSLIGRSTNGQPGRALILDPTSLTQTLKLREPDETDVVPPMEDDLPVDLQRTSDLGRSICDVAIIDQAFRNGAAETRRLTISEPAKGYPDIIPSGPHFDPNGGPSGRKIGWYGVGTQRKPIDTPLDDLRSDGETRLMLPEPNSANANGGFVNDKVRIVECFSWVYLQRLANPKLPYDKDTNPYMTVDSLSANVTVFNGEVKEEERWPKIYTEVVGGQHPKIDLGLDKLKYSNDIAAPYFSSLQRGYTIRNKDREPLTWDFEMPSGPAPQLPASGAAGPARVAGMEPVPQNQMGRNGAGRGNPNSNTFNSILDCTIGFLNRSYVTESNNPNERTALKTPPLPQDLKERQFKPKIPFPWLTWNNRPYANANELLQVSNVRSSRLSRAFSTLVSTINESYSGKPAEWPSSTAPEKFVVDGAFGHLPNFFRHTEDTSTDTIAGMYRMLDYLHVPSPFVKTETWLNPVMFGNSIVNNVNDPRYLRQPPFNRIAEYREPGRVNINTVVSGDVWDGGLLHRELEDPTLPWDPVSNNYLESWLRNRTLAESSTNPRIYGHAGPMFLANSSTHDLVTSRRGYGSSDSILELDDNTPTFFENPFRSADAADLVPVPAMLLDNTTTPANRKGVNVTMLRQDEPSPATKKPPLFAADTKDDPGTTPLVENAFQDSDRNSYFSYQPMSRLSSMTTTRSNVYAVWVTIGFFEVTEAPDWNHPNAATRAAIRARFNDIRALYDKVYPEGYMLGKEAGSDTGDIRRVREFAMIDRTVPVAFEPGQNHNVEKAIRLRRRIE